MIWAFVSTPGDKDPHFPKQFNRIDVVLGSQVHPLAVAVWPLVSYLNHHAFYW